MQKCPQKTCWCPTLALHSVLDPAWNAIIMTSVCRVRLRAELSMNPHRIFSTEPVVEQTTVKPGFWLQRTCFCTCLYQPCFCLLAYNLLNTTLHLYSLFKCLLVSIKGRQERTFSHFLWPMTLVWKYQGLWDEEKISLAQMSSKFSTPTSCAARPEDIQQTTLGSSGSAGQ